MAQIFETSDRKQVFAHLKIYKMGSLLYILAVVLIVIWAISFLALHVTSGLIHLLLVVAVILFIIKLVTGRSV
jgi:hypothetical protein